MFESGKEVRGQFTNRGYQFLFVSKPLAAAFIYSAALAAWMYLALYDNHPNAHPVRRALLSGGWFIWWFAVIMIIHWWTWRDELGKWFEGSKLGEWWERLKERWERGTPKDREPKDRTKSQAFADLVNRALTEQHISDDQLALRITQILNRGAPGKDKRIIGRTQVRRVRKAEVAAWDDPELVDAWVKALALDRAKAFVAARLLPPEVDEVTLRRILDNGNGRPHHRG